ncbi:MAG: Rpn family recombination-promoting nuclease/putative transposase [Rivularia sp. (in: cyanobacteria)]
MRRDAIFYTIFQRSPELIFEFIEPIITSATNYSFQSVEVKEPTFRIDGVFLPPQDASPRVVIFAEVQFQADELLYHRFFAESQLYMYRNALLQDDWYGVIIFPSRNLEPKNTTIHQPLLECDKVRRIYLDELDNSAEQSIGISLMQLTIASENQVVESAKRLIERVKQEQISTLPRNDLFDIITTIAVYKFSNLSREEVEAMLGIKLEETRVYREAKEEGREEGRLEGKQEVKLELVPAMLARGMSVAEVSELLGLTEEQVNQAAGN